MNLLSLFSQIRVDMTLLVLVALLLVSAVGVVYIKHTSRSEFVALQKLERERDALNEEWSRLLLEQSTWASPARVEQQARTRLDMTVPGAEDTVVIRP